MKRLLGTNEHFLWLRDQRWSVNFTMTASVQGLLSVKQLSDALAWVQHRHPLLRVRIELNEEQKPQFVSGEVPNIPLRVLERQAENHWCQEVATEIVSPFPWNKGPLFRVVFLQGETVSDLIFTCHHSIGDALSVVYLIRDILQELGNPRRDRQKFPELPPLEELIGLSQLDNNSNTVTENVQKQKITPSHSNAYNTEVTPPTWRPSILHWELSLEDTSKLISRCRQQQVSVHGAICAAFLLALAKEENLSAQTMFKCLSPLNVRNYLVPPIGSDLGVYIALPITAHRIDSQTDFWELAKEVKYQLKETVSKGKLFASIPQLQSWLSMRPEPEAVYQQLLNKGLHLAISNLGRLDMPWQFGHLTLEAIYGPTLLGLENVRVVSVATLGGKMFCTFTYLESVIPQAMAEKTKTKAMQLIQKAIS